jgi:hypothetical protein
MVNVTLAAVTMIPHVRFPESAYRRQPLGANRTTITCVVWLANEWVVRACHDASCGVVQHLVDDSLQKLFSTAGFHQIVLQA